MKNGSATYDANGNIIRRDRNGVYEFTANWNSFNKPVSLFAGLEVRDDSNHVWWECNESDYDQQGRLVRFEQGNALVTTQTFNPLTGRMEGVEIRQGLGLSDYGFGYDRLGNLTQRWAYTESHPG